MKKSFLTKFRRPLALVLVLLMFAAYALWDSHQMLAAADANNYQTYKPTNEETKFTSKIVAHF